MSCTLSVHDTHILTRVPGET